MVSTKHSTASRFNIKNLDFFAVPIELWFNGKKSTQTVIGFLFTLGLLGLMAATIYSSGRRLFYRIKPTVLINTGLNQTLGDFDFLASDLSFPIISLDMIPQKYIVLNSQVVNMPNYVRISSKFRFSNETVDLEFCSSSIQMKLDYLNNSLVRLQDNNSDAKQEKVKNLLQQSSSICLKDKPISFRQIVGADPIIEVSADVIGGKSQFFDLINANRTLARLKLSLIAKLLNVSSFENPYSYEVIEQTKEIDQSLITILDLWYRETFIKSDVGFIMEQFSTESIYSFSEFNESFSLRSANSLSQLFVIRYNFSYAVLVVDRYYMKAQELAALVGGLMQVFMIIAKIICRFVAYNFQELNFINTLFLKEDYDTLTRVRKKSFRFTQQVKEGMSPLKRARSEMNSQNPMASRLSGIPNSTIAHQVSRFNNMSYTPIKANENSELEKMKSSKEYEIIETKDNKVIVDKLLDISSKNLAKLYLMKIDLRYSTHNFFMMKWLCCKEIVEERNKFKFFKNLLRSKLDLAEVFSEITNYKRLKQYQFTPSQQMLLNLDCKLTTENYVPIHSREGNLN